MVTIKDVAREAKVSVSTVSLVINNNPGISTQTRIRVLKCIEKLGYRPNLVARSFKTKKTRVIGVLAPSITNPHIAQIVHSLGRYAREESYATFLYTFSQPNDVRRENFDVFDELFDRRIDGVICCHWPFMDIAGQGGDAGRMSPVANLTRASTPFVFIGEELPFDRFLDEFHVAEPERRSLFHLLSIDRVQSTFRVVTHLLSIGHRRIGVIAEDPESHYPNSRKIQGYRTALEQSSIAYDERLVASAETSIYGSQEVFDLLMSQPDPPTALFCTNDILALGALKSAHRRGIRIPEDLAVVGYDNIPLSNYSVPALSTVSQPVDAMAREAIRRIKEVAAGRPEQRTRMVFETEFVIRESCL